MRRAFDYYAEVGLKSDAVAVANHPILTYWGLAGVAQLIAQALELVASDSLEAGHLLSKYGYVLNSELGDYEAAIKALDSALAIARLEHEPFLEMETLTNSSQVDLFQSRWQSSLDKSLQAIELVPDVENPRAELIARISGACSLLVMGERERGREFIRPIMPFMERFARFWQGQALWFHEHPYRLEGDWQAARDINNQGYEAGTWDPFFLATRVMLEYQVGEFSEGEIYIERIFAAMRAAPPGPWPEYAYSALTTAYVARIIGVSDRLEVALSAGMTVVSSPVATPLIASLAEDRAIPYRGAPWR